MARKLKAIVIEDNRLMREALCAHLENLHVDVIGTAADGREGVEMAVDLEPDLILLDIMMPVMNGFLALQEIIGRLPDAFVVMMTAVESKEVEQESRMEGAQDYIVKSLPPAELAKRLFRHIDFLRNHP